MRMLRLGHAIAYLAKKIGLISDCKLALIRSNPHVAELHATGTVLKSERAGRQFVVVRIDSRLPIQFHDEMAATRRDLIVVPFVARLEHDLRRSYLDDTAGSIGRIGPSIEDVDLVTG